MTSVAVLGNERAGGDSRARRVTSIELFFDLVFVFSLTQVTGFLADHLTWTGMLQGGALFVALWSAWAAYSWLTNAVPADDVIPARLVLIAAMAAMLVVSLATPDAFGDDGLVFGLAFFVVRTLQVALFVVATGDTPEVRRGIMRLAPGYIGSPALIILAGFTDGAVQAALWAVALLLTFGIAYIGGVGGLRVHAGHFAERYGLVVIIALGESIVSVGVGAAGLELDAGIITASVLSIVLATGLWWMYFDIVTLMAEQRLSRATGKLRAELARDAYSGFHIPIVAGIILVALGLKKTLGHVEDPLETIPAFALCGGVALYLLGHNGFRWRMTGSVSRARLVVAILSVVLIAAAGEIAALGTLAILAALVAGLATFETVTGAALRYEARHHEAA